MKIKIIDLLNKKANEEELPKKFKYDDNVFIYDNEKNDYIYEHGNVSFFCDYCNPIFNFADCLETFNKEVEIIEEEKEIEKLNYKVEQLENPSHNESLLMNMIRQNKETINKLIEELKRDK